MKIAIWWEQESTGGVDSHLLTLLRNWPEPLDTFVLFHNRGNQGYRRIAPELADLDAVTAVEFPDVLDARARGVRRLAGRFASPFMLGRLRRFAARFLAKHGPFDAVIADDGGYPAAWSCLGALWAGHRLGIEKRLLLVHHAATPRMPFRLTIEQLVDRAVQGWATDIVAVSRATRSTLIERRGFNTERNPIRVIHNGVDAPAANAPAVDLRHQFGIRKEAVLVGLLGRVERYKGQEDLILALAQLDAHSRSRLAVVLIGSGDETEIERLGRMADRLGVSSQVIVTGYLEGHPGAVIRQLDLLVMLTKDFEGFGLTLAEAMRVGTPVLATAVGGVSEFVTPDVGLLVPPESPREVAAALTHFLEEPDRARDRAARARDHIRGFSGDVMARAFHRLLTL